MTNTQNKIDNQLLTIKKQKLWQIKQLQFKAVALLMFTI